MIVPGTTAVWQACGDTSSNNLGRRERELWQNTEQQQAVIPHGIFWGEQF